MNGGRPSLILFGKYPVPGSVKTRLVPPLDSAGAASLYRAFLVDAMTAVTPLADRFDITLFVADETDIPLMRDLMSEEGVARIELGHQSGESLGERLAHAFRSALDSGASSVAIIGTDAPTLPMHFLPAAFDAIANADVVMGPAEDGGYYLIGMRQLHESILINMPYSTSKLADEVRRRAASGGLRLVELPLWYDVDDCDGLLRLRQNLSHAGQMTRIAMEGGLQGGSGE